MFRFVALSEKRQRTRDDWFTHSNWPKLRLGLRFLPYECMILKDMGDPRVAGKYSSGPRLGMVTAVGIANWLH